MAVWRACRPAGTRRDCSGRCARRVLAREQRRLASSAADAEHGAPSAATERTPLGGRLRRPRLRGELRRPGGGARARRAVRAPARADARPLRGRRAPDLGLRGSRPPGSRRSGSRARSARRSTSSCVHTPHRPRACRCRGPSPPSTTAELCALLDAQNDAGSRPRRSTGAPGDDASHTDRGDLSRAAVVDALGWRRVLRRRRLPAARRAALARPRGAPARQRATSSRSGSTAATCPPATAGASPPTTSCGSASARSTRAST